MKNFSGLVLVVALATIGLVVFLMWVGMSNKEISLRTQIEAQQVALKNTYDAVWKIISGRAGVANEYKEAFRENYTAIMEGRYGEDGADSMLLFITESNPEFSPDLYKDVSSAIEVQRTKFANAQNALVDLKREHDTLLRTFPGSMMLAGRKPVELQLVTSTRTEEVFEAGKEDESPNPFAGT